MNVSPRTPTLQALSIQRTVRPLPASERRERGFGIGYGNSSGYATDKRYTPASGDTRFRFA